MFPLLFCLMSLDDVREEAALNFGQIESVADQYFDPEFVVLKGKVEDKPS